VLNRDEIPRTWKCKLHLLLHLNFDAEIPSTGSSSFNRRRSMIRIIQLRFVHFDGERGEGNARACWAHRFSAWLVDHRAIEMIPRCLSRALSGSVIVRHCLRNDSDRSALLLDGYGRSLGPISSYRLGVLEDCVSARCLHLSYSNEAFSDSSLSLSLSLPFGQRETSLSWEDSSIKERDNCNRTVLTSLLQLYYGMTRRFCLGGIPSPEFGAERVRIAAARLDTPPCAD